MQFLLISFLFMALERIMPKRRQQVALRRGIVTDTLHWLFNGYLFYRIFYAAAAGFIFERMVDTMRSGGLGSVADFRLLATQPLWLQFIILFLVQDFLMWCTHNLLHRVPALWAIHRVHHSITTMDWIGNMRYHWGEVVIYNSVLAIPLMLLGADASLFTYIAIFNTLIGHFNHSNLDLTLGPLKYVFNSPEMHLWHHDKDGPGSHNKNFAIGLSAWDWIFRTAYLPGKEEPQEPRELGFAGIEEFPTGFLGQQLLPLSTRWKGTVLYSTVLLCLLGVSLPGQTKSGPIAIDKKARSVSFTGTIHPAHYNGSSGLKDHHFIVWRMGRAADNALVTADANDLEVQRALESLGAEAGNNLTADSWERRADRSSAAPDLHVKGSAVDVAIAWKGHAPVHAGELFADRGGRGFSFRLGGHESLIARWHSGCVVCLESCPGGRISNDRYTMRDLNDGKARFDLRTASLPAEGTAVTVTLTLK